MEKIQRFRLFGTTNIVKIPFDHVNGQNVIYWEDIKDVFPGVSHVVDGEVVINKLRDSNRMRVTPHCIEHRADAVFEVYVSSSGDHVHVDSPTETPSRPCANGPVDAPTNASADTPLTIQSDYRADSQLASDQTLHPTSRPSPPAEDSTASSSVDLDESISSLAIASGTSDDHASTENCQNFQSKVIHKLDALHDQGAMTQQIAQEVWKLQKQMNDRLILIQSKTEAILTQQLELAEYPIPRLFIVLPEEPVKYDPANWFRTKFRLHFICECGKHTETSDSNITHHLHVANHEGYLVREPTVFFKKYGPFLLLMLELIKVGTSVAGHVVPALATLQAIELADSVKQSVELITAKIDLSLECIDRQLSKVQTSPPEGSCDSESPATMTPQDLANYLNNVEGLEGVELRQLGSFLKTSQEDSLLGNLYRMTTSDGHVKWVCRDHYRASYQEKQVEKLREVVKLREGEFDEQLGKITISLSSSIEATEFYTAISKAKGVLELNITLYDPCDRSDLDALETVLRNSRVAIVRLNLLLLRTSRLLVTSSQYGALDRIKDLLQMRELHIDLPVDFVKIPNFLSKTSSRLCKLSVGLSPLRLKSKESHALAVALKTNSTLTILYLGGRPIGDNTGQALVEALKINSTLASLNLCNNSIGDNTGQALAEALKVNSTLTNLGLSYNSIGDNTGQALAEALKINSTLTSLDLSHSSIGDNAGQALAEALKINSTLTSLDLSHNSIGDNAGQALAEALKINSTLTSLDLSHSSIGDNAGQALAEALKINSTLTSLDLSHNSIGDNAGQALAEALKINSTLTSLDLGHNSIGDNAGQALAEALKVNSTLTNLGLSYISIGDNARQALAEALKINSTLTSLDLSYNFIGDNAGQALAEALKINSTLTSLNLAGSSIGDNAGQALAEALEINSTLTSLDLVDNSIGDNAGQALADALKINRTLITLGLTRNSIGRNTKLALAVAMELNPTLINWDL